MSALPDPSPWPSERAMVLAAVRAGPSLCKYTELAQAALSLAHNREISCSYSRLALLQRLLADKRRNLAEKDVDLGGRV